MIWPYNHAAQPSFHHVHIGLLVALYSSFQSSRLRAIMHAGWSPVPANLLPYPLLSLIYLLFFILNYTENVTSLGRSCLTTPTRPRCFHYMPSLVPSALPSNYLLQLITWSYANLMSVPLSDYKAPRARILSRWLATISKRRVHRKQANICSMNEEFQNWQYLDAVHLLFQGGQYPKDSSRQPTQWTWRMWRHRSSLIWAIM